jgi:hypothetical protein
MTNVRPPATKARNILTYLPFTLFFPIAVVYAGFFLFLLALIMDGDYRARWDNIKKNPMFRPILLLSAVLTVVALYSDWQLKEFWPSFAHYQSYLILLLFLSVGAGEWQEKAVKAFIAGALFAATVYYLTIFGIVPAIDPFTSYVVYSGNKSILLGLLMSIAAGFVLHDLLAQHTMKQDRQHDARSRAWRIVIFVYICGALLFVSKGRTGYLVFLALILLVMLKSVRLSIRGWAAATLVLALVSGFTWQKSDSLRMRVGETISDVQRFVQNPTGYAQTSTGIRLQMYRHTLEMIEEKPLQGFGIGAWMPVFLHRYGSTIAEASITPHNDYLLFAAEGGLIGLGALLFVWLAQLRIALAMKSRKGSWLFFLTVSIMICGMFNAVLRDGVFAMAFMILLAIPLAGAVSSRHKQDILA